MAVLETIGIRKARGHIKYKESGFLKRPSRVRPARSKVRLVRSNLVESVASRIVLNRIDNLFLPDYFDLFFGGENTKRFSGCQLLSFLFASGGAFS